MKVKMTDPVHALVAEMRKLCLPFEVSERWSYNPPTIKQFHGMDRKHPRSCMNSQYNSHPPALSHTIYHVTPSLSYIIYSCFFNSQTYHKDTIDKKNKTKAGNGYLNYWLARYLSLSLSYRKMVNIITSWVDKNASLRTSKLPVHSKLWSTPPPVIFRMICTPINYLSLANLVFKLFVR